MPSSICPNALFRTASARFRWDTWAQADVLQKRTDKTEELFNKMNVSMYAWELDPISHAFSASRKKSDSKKTGGTKSNSKRSTLIPGDLASQVSSNNADDSHDSSSTTATLPSTEGVGVTVRWPGELFRGHRQTSTKTATHRFGGKTENIRE